MKQIRDAEPGEHREYPKTPEEFARVQRNRLLQEIGAVPENTGRRRLDIALTGETTAEHTVPASVLGAFLSSFQDSVSAVAQALAGRPTNTAAIPREISDATTLRAVATFPSSFGMALYGPPNDEDTETLRTVLDESVERILTIADLADGAGQSDELLAEQLAPLGPRSMKHIGAMTARLSTAGLGLSVSWYDRTGQARRSIWSLAGVQRVRDLCEHSDFTPTERITVVGRLVSASSLRSRVEIRLDSGELIQAGTDAQLTDRLGEHFDKRVAADLEVTGVKFSGGRERKIYTALEFSQA